MTYVSQLFAKHNPEIRDQIHSLYVPMVCSVDGITEADAKDVVDDAVARCITQGTLEGTISLPADFGDRLVASARKGDPDARCIVEKAQREGASDDDIREWWNLPDLTARMVQWSEDFFRRRTFKQAMQRDGLSASEAAVRVCNTFPIYGDPDDLSKAAGDNRPLPNELRGRIDAFRQSRGHKFISEQLKNFGSYNAFVRHMIREGLL